MRHKISLIIPTKDRQAELERLLSSVVSQSILPDEIIIVDGSQTPQPEHYQRKFPALTIKYAHTRFPRLTGQRNMGLSLINPDIDLVCFLDDDIVLASDSLKAMLLFWEHAAKEVGGAVFNIINEKKPSALVSLKKIFYTGAKERGLVLKSGYNTLICPADETRHVQWLFGGGTVWRRELFDHYTFDEWFEGTGLCEDLDFSYQVGKQYKLAVVAPAKVEHLTDLVKRRNNRKFGITQIVNRYYFVKKNPELSAWLCHWAGVGQLFENLIRGLAGLRREYFARALGNLQGFLLLGTVRASLKKTGPK